MSLARLQVSDFRNLHSIQMEPIEVGFNLIYGRNGSGKTSILESIYYLSFGRSFRSVYAEHIVRRSADKLSIFANLKTPTAKFVPIGLERDLQGGLNIRYEGTNLSSIADLAKILPIQLINSQCYNLLDSGPSSRRKYLDWGIFYLNSAFLNVWRSYRRVLKQRNAAILSNLAVKEINIWAEKLSEYATQLDEWRVDYMNELLPLLSIYLSELLPNLRGSSPEELSIQYYSGWKKDVSYIDTLKGALQRDMQLGYTQFGPHRADLKITINRQPAKDFLSRGQQKLFVCAMILAQGELLRNKLNKRPIYLVDDLPSELDSVSKSNLVTLLSKQEAQVFVTAVERDIFEKCPTNKPVKLFHVEHGNLTQIVE